MTKVLFYHLQDNTGSLLAVLVNLVELSLAEQLDILILSDNEAQAIPLHNHLEQRFQLGGEFTLAETPVSRYSVSWGGSPAHHHGMLINLTDSLPPWFSRFDYLAEVISGSDNFIDNKRQSYRTCRDRGHPLKFHDLTAK